MSKRQLKSLGLYAGRRLGKLTGYIEKSSRCETVGNLPNVLGLMVGRAETKRGGKESNAV